MKIRCALAGIALLAASANADIQYFDNSSGAFTWAESFDVNFEFHHGASLDLTLPPSQPGDQSIRGIMAYTEIFFTSNQFVTTRLTADFPAGVTVARGAPVFINHGQFNQGAADPAVTFSPGSLVAAGAGGGEWSDQADVDYRTGQFVGSLIGGRALIGVRLPMADGFHYGWIDLVDNGYFANPSFTAVSWAYETLPNTPIPAGAVPTPGALPALGLIVLPLLRRRR